MLKVVNLKSGYHGLVVVDGVSLRVQPGEAVALVGVNGSGKSTLLKTIAGLVPATEGRVLLAGRDVARQPAHRVAAAGCTLVPEGRGLFPGLSVLDNLRMGGYARRLAGRQLARFVDQAAGFFPALQNRLGQPAGTLSGGQQQMLALARALVGEPQLLLLDEPSTGLAPLVVREIFDKIRGLKQAGVSLMLAEQNVQEALRLADRAYVMQTGRIVLEGPAAELARSGEVQKAYLGM
jgi:branched-chain amino acid transport system ATP-binding protein